MVSLLTIQSAENNFKEIIATSHFNKRMKIFILQINEMKSTLKYPRLPHYLIMLHLINALDPLTTIVFYKGHNHLLITSEIPAHLYFCL